MWKQAEIVYCDSLQRRQVDEIAARIRKAFPDVEVSVVPYNYRPGGGWQAVYRKDKAAAVDTKLAKR
jgi:hypothetical protein